MSITTVRATLDEFTRSYIEAALWSSCDDNDKPLDATYSVEDIAPETLAKMVADCQAFQSAHGELFTEDNCTHYSGEYSITEYAGHDFWLTRNGHGCGFWDGDWTEPAATTLTDAAHACGEVDLYVGDDGLIYS